MNGGICTAAACVLAQNGRLVSFSLVTLAGLVDSINPCAITVIILLLTYLVIFAQKPKRILPTGVIYVAAVFLSYLTIGLIFYKSFRLLNLGFFRFYFNKILGSLLLLAGVINIKDFFLPRFGPHLEIPPKAYPFLKKLTEQVSYPASFFLGVFVTLLETPCSLPIYAGTASVLAQSGLPRLVILAYFLYYNFLFILPLILILLLVWKGSEWKIVELQEFGHKNKRPAKLLMGILLLAMGIWLVLW